MTSLLPDAVSGDLNSLLNNGREFIFRKGQILGDTDSDRHLNLVTDGYIKRYLITNDGTLSTQAIYGKGDIYPLTSVFNRLLQMSLYKGPEVFYYEAIMDGRLRRLDLDDLAETARDHPELYKDILKVAGSRLSSNIQRLENLALKTFYNRLAHQLVYYAKEFGTERPNGVRINIPLTHADLATVVGATRETVSNSVSELRNKNLIKTGKYIVVKDIKKLESEAYSQNGT